MNEPQIVCPKCRTAIRLTDSLAPPLLAETREQFEQRLAQREAGFAKREDDTRKTAVGWIKGSDQWAGVVMTTAISRTSGIASGTRYSLGFSLSRYWHSSCSGSQQV